MTQSAARARAEIISPCRGLKLSSRVLIASGTAARGNPHGKLGTAGLFQGGTSSSNPLSSSGESAANLSFRRIESSEPIDTPKPRAMPAPSLLPVGLLRPDADHAGRQRDRPALAIAL